MNSTRVVAVVFFEAAELGGVVVDVGEEEAAVLVTRHNCGR